MISGRFLLFWQQSCRCGSSAGDRQASTSRSTATRCSHRSRHILREGNLTSRKTVALIMPVRNEERSAQQTLDSVFASTRLPDEIVVADGMSTDRTVARILLLLYFGNTIDRCWIDEMVRPFESDERLDLVGGIFVPDVRSDFEACVAAIQFEQQQKLLELPAERRCAVLPARPAPGGLSVGLTRAAWDRLGGMPDWLRAAEDKTFGRKLMATNPRWVFNPNAVLFHHMRATPRQVCHQMWTYFRGEGRTGRIGSHVLKLCAFYLVQLGLLAGCVYAWPSGALCAGLIILYVYSSGVRKVTHSGGPLARAWRLAPRVLFARDAGMIAGETAGLADWIFQPIYRRRLREYESGHVAPGGGDRAA